MAETPFASAMEFLDTLGAFDIVFPFLLIFTLTYGILEKTKVLGTIDTDGKEPKHNLNAMVAFCMGFLTVATPGIVNFLNFITVWVVVIFLTIIFLVFLVFAVHPDVGKALSSKASKVAFTLTILGIMILIFFIGFYKDRDPGPIRDWFANFLTSELFNTIIFFVFIIILMLIVVKGGQKSNGGEK